MSDIFISYAREDKDRAERLADIFSRQSWSVWWDREIPPGQSFDETIENALHSARCIVVLWSKDSVSSRWVKTEAAEGASRGILIPVMMDKVPIPLEFKRIEAADLSDWRGALPNFELDHLLKTVAGILSGAPSAGVSRMSTNAKMRSRRWWKTMPGILAATGSAIIVIAVLIVVPQQIRVIDRFSRDVTQTQNDTKTPTEATKQPTAPGAAKPSPLGEATQIPALSCGWNEVKLANAAYAYKMLAVQLDGYNAERLVLRFTIRMTAHTDWPGNFIDGSFRLLVDGVSRAPEVI